MSLDQRPDLGDLAASGRRARDLAATVTPRVLVTTTPPTRTGPPDLSLVAPAKARREAPTHAPGTTTGSTRRRTWLLLSVDVLAVLVLSTAVLPLGPQRAVAPGPADLLVAVVWVVLLASSHAYDPRPVSFGLHGVRSVATAGLALVTAGLAATAVSGHEPAPGAILGLAAAAAATAAGLRWVADQPLLARHTTGTVRVVVAGHRRDVDRVLAELGSAGTRGFQPVAVCLSGPGSLASYDLPVLRGLDNLAAAASQHGAGAVIVAPCRHLDPVRLRRLGWALEAGGTQLFVAAGLLDVARNRTTLGCAGSLSMLHVREAELRGGRRLLKHVTERVLACVSLVVLGPALLALAVVVRAGSAGPAFYRQTRVGKGGVPFSIFKFRTMSTDADVRRSGLVASATDRTVLFKLRDDPRVTRVGRFLRRYSLDELPQLINVARGEMSLVGPRPPLPSEVAQYEPDAHRRLAVTPGMTGLWQVSGRSELTWEESLRLDLRYVDNWSLGLDLRIVLRTAHAVLGHRGAY